MQNLPYINSLKFFITRIFIGYNEESKGRMRLRKRISSNASIACAYYMSIPYVYNSKYMAKGSSF
jgi:hypothetical protein